MDDKTLLVGACRSLGESCMKGRGDGHDLFSVRVDGGPLQNITGGGEPAFNALPSPGGSQIAFLYLPPADRWHWERAELWVMDRDGTHRRRLPTPSGPMAPAWSRDGRSIAFTLRMNDTTTISAHDLWVVDVASSSPARALDVGPFASDGVSAISWSADDSQLLLAGTDAAGHAGLYSFDVDTGSRHLLVPGATDGAWR
jgi:Tol biopolymer transport system component